jgi:hypothetical protein
MKLSFAKARRRRIDKDAGLNQAGEIGNNRQTRKALLSVKKEIIVRSDNPC